MEILGVIPARYAATRFPGKPLTPLCGRPMLHWVLRGCLNSRLVIRWIVATDDERIAAYARSRDVEAILTDPDLPSGTDRVWAAAQTTDATHIINVQGDEPLMEAAAIDILTTALLDRGCPTATLARQMDPDENPVDPNRVKVVIDDQGRALYFSRSPIPYPRNAKAASALGSRLHLGCYAYTREALSEWVSLPPHPLEQAEGLEQLRALANGIPMAVGMVDMRLLAVDVPEDVPDVEAALTARYQL
ncbi:MAG: 3-deoxy-manno-octulosonate cytidylyltransferase [bacterium]